MRRTVWLKRMVFWHSVYPVLLVLALLPRLAFADAWRPTAPMSAPRYAHTATLLAGNKVLVAGGYNGADELAGVEIYDAASASWSAAASLAVPRYHHTATPLAHGRVLVAGGYNSNGELAAAEIYSPASNSWSAAGALNTSRYLHTATLLPDGRVLVAGGFSTNGPVGSVELFDPVSNTWTAASDMRTRRAAHTATLIPGGKVLVAGGNDGTKAVASAEVYDAAANTWEAGGVMSLGRAFHSAIAFADGRVLVAGGGSPLAEVYDPSSNSWASAGSMGSTRDSHALIRLIDSRVLATGGFNGRGSSATSELKQLRGNGWVAAATLNTSRVQHTATLLADGRVLVTGGISDQSLPVANADLYTYTTPTDQTITLGALPDRNLSERQVAVNAAASSGLPVVLSATGSCSATGSVIVLNQEGVCTVTASQDGSADVNAAPSVTRAFSVSVFAGYNVLPDTVITSGPAGNIAVNSVTFTWSAAGDIISPRSFTFAHRLDPIEPKFSEFGVETSKTYNNLTGGSYTFYVKAKDSDQREDPTPAIGSFTVNVSVVGVFAVDCSVSSLQVAVDAAVAGQTINVSGTCNENILLSNEKQSIILSGSPGSVINGTDPTRPVVNVRGRGITIQGLTIYGGSDGIVVNRGSFAEIIGNVIQGSQGGGVVINQSSYGLLTGNTISNHAGAGIWISESASARIGFSSDSASAASANTIRHNLRGIQIDSTSSARIVGNTIANNNGDGIVVLRNSHADIASNTIGSNAGNAVTVSDNSVVQLGEDTGTGIFKLENSGIGNSGFAVKCTAKGIADGRLGTLIGNGGAKSFDGSCIDSLL